MLICASLEAKVLSQIATALTGVNGVTTGGAWQSAGAGLVKWVESASTPAFVHVTVGSPSRATYSAPTVSFECNISILSRIELDADAAILFNVADKIQTMLDAWQSATYQQPFTSLDLPTLTIDEVSVNGGATPVLDGNNATVYFQLTLSGSYRETTNEESN